MSLGYVRSVVVMMLLLSTISNSPMASSPKHLFEVYKCHASDQQHLQPSTTPGASDANMQAVPQCCLDARHDFALGSNAVTVMLQSVCVLPSETCT